MHEDQYNRFVKRAKEVMPKTISEHNPSKQDEIISMAREAGALPISYNETRYQTEYSLFGDQLERFAALVASHEREKQAEQEPVGYWDGKFSKGGASALYEVPQASAFGYHYENYPLYAAPVRTKDLTHEEKARIVSEYYPSIYQIIDAVIAADREKNK